jgi:hypothetical protein
VIFHFLLPRGGGVTRFLKSGQYLRGMFRLELGILSELRVYEKG